MSEPSTDRVRVRRGAKKGHYDQAAIEGILDRGLVGHVAFSSGDDVYCIPMLYARIGAKIYIHGSSASRTMRALGGGTSACLTVTVLDGLVLARSIFEHSANYESVVALGRFSPVTGTNEQLAALEAFAEKLLPGRWAEVRAPSSKELKATTILSMPLTEASAKRRSGPPDDDDTPDAAIDTWAGVIPLATSFGAPIASPGLRSDIPLSASVQRLFSDGTDRLGPRKIGG